MSGAVLLGYNALALLSRSTNLATMLRADSVWSRRYASPGQGGSAQEIVAAVQTLRNSVLVSIFIGTVAFNTMTTALVDVRGASVGSFQYVVALIVAVLAASSFLCFAICIRSAAHSGYVVGGATFLEAAPVASAAFAAASAPLDTEASASAVLVGLAHARASAISDAEAERDRLRSHLLHLVRTQSVFFSIAFRQLYSVIPFLFAAAGPVVLLFVTGAMTAFLLIIDFSHRINAYKWIGTVI